jgi:DNA-binding YbaB/EbfC family protein
MKQGGFDPGALMKQAAQMRKGFEKLENELKEMIVEGDAGGGMVKCRASAAGDVISLKLSKEVVDPEDIETLEDLILAAVRNALDKAQDKAKAERDRMTNAMGLPPGLI